MNASRAKAVGTLAGERQCHVPVAIRHDGALALSDALRPQHFTSRRQHRHCDHIGANGMIRAQGRMAEHGELETARNHWLPYRESIQIKGDDEQRRERRALRATSPK